MENRAILDNNEVIENKEIIEEKKKIDIKAMMQKDLNVKEALIVIGAAALIFAYIGMIIYPNWKKLKGTLDELSEVQRQITACELEIDNIGNLNARLLGLENDLEFEKKNLNHNMEDGMFLVGLSNLINSLGVDLVSYTIDETIPYNSFYAIPTNIELRGDYNHIRKVMNYLEDQKNTTQILDYSMETYMEEAQPSTVTSTETIPDSVVYWTQGGDIYHKEDCSILESEAGNNEVIGGSASESGKSNYCETCKPYTTSEVSSESTSTPVAKGDVVARFRFVMYSTQNPSITLNNSNVSSWKPGKYNPFASTK